MDGRPSVFLNLGAGLDRMPAPWVNVDAYGTPDLRWDLNDTPFPWADGSVDLIYAAHIFEHLEDWWPAFRECGRILRPGGLLEMRVPDESSSTALGWRDHRHIFTINSFHGAVGYGHATNAWAVDEKNTVPLKLVSYNRVPFPKHNWLLKIPWLLAFLADHGRNFIHEQRFVWERV